MATHITLLNRKTRLEKQLKDRGIVVYEIKHLPYLDFDESKFAPAFEVGARMIILNMCSIVASNLNETETIVNWLKQEHLWQYVSPLEKELFSGNIEDDIHLASFSWQIESSYTLAWALNLVDVLHPPISCINEDQFAVFEDLLPKYDAKLGSYLDNLNLREKGEIFEENLLNELATSYFRDLTFNKKENSSDIDRYVSFQRHKVLNWVRRLGDITDWDDTDTST